MMEFNNNAPFSIDNFKAGKFVMQLEFQTDGAEPVTHHIDVIAAEEYYNLLKRFRHLTSNPTIRKYDEWDKKKQDYCLDISKADLVEVVRCKDCREYTGAYKEDYRINNDLCRLEQGVYMHRKPDDFCSRAIRKEDERK